jgi:hypothetical protein
MMQQLGLKRAYDPTLPLQLRHVADAAKLAPLGPALVEISDLGRRPAIKSC